MSAHARARGDDAPSSTGDASSSPARASLSEKMLGLSFMRRARGRGEGGVANAPVVAAAQTRERVDARPEPAVFAKNRALINLPKKRASDGGVVARWGPFGGRARVSFGGANPEVEAAMKEMAERKRRARALKRAKSVNADADVRAEEMADAAFGKKHAREKAPELGARKRARA